MSLYLDKLIADYNQRVRALDKYNSLTIERTYSKEELTEEEVEKIKEELTEEEAKKIWDLLNQFADAANDLDEIMKENNSEAVDGAKEAAELVEKIEKAYRDAIKVRHMSRNRIVSPRMYRKIMSYYRKHRRLKYYSKYKIDNELHNFLMELGSYLEGSGNGIEDRMVRDFSSSYHYYALPSIPVLIRGGMKNVLGYISSTFTGLAHVMEIGLHVLLEVSPKVLHFIPLLPVFLPHLLAAFLVSYLGSGLLIIIGYALHPERKSKFKRLIEKIKINLGIRKNYMHAAYIIYLYKLYDILSAINSYIIEVGELIKLGRNVSEQKSAKKLEKKAEKSAHAVGHKDKILGLLGKKLDFKLFKDAKNKIETLDESISVNRESYEKLMESIKNGNHELNVIGYRFAVSSDAAKKLADYYGDKFKGGGEWIDVTIQYTGGAYHKSAEPFNKVNISGFSGDTKETAIFIGALLALADQLVVNKIGEQEFEEPLMTIDLQKVKWLAYRTKPLIDALFKPLKELIDWVIGLITKKGKKSGKLDPNDLGSLMFEAYMSINGIKATEVEEKEKQGEEETQSEETTEEVEGTK